MKGPQEMHRHDLVDVDEVVAVELQPDVGTDEGADAKVVAEVGFCFHVVEVLLAVGELFCLFDEGKGVTFMLALFLDGVMDL